MNERRFAAWPVATVVALLVAHGISACFSPPSLARALALSVIAAVIATVAILEAPAPHLTLTATTLGALAVGATSGGWIAACAACLGAGIAAHALATGLPRYLPAIMEGARQRHPRLAWCWAALAVACVFSYLRFATFMDDGDFHAGAALPTQPPKHMCLPSYLRGAELSREEPQAVYAADRYERGASSQIAGIAPWLRDPFMYPPPALLPPRLALLLSHDLATLRTTWFALQGLFFVAVSLALARALRPQVRALYLWLWPALAMAWPTLHNFEYGQAHLVTLGLALAGMLAFGARRRVLGGALLGAAVAIKIFPGLLVLWLLLKRRWHDATAAIVATLAWFAVALPVVGVEVYRQFFGAHLARLASGEAFATFLEHAAFDTPHLSPPAVVFTLEALGIPLQGWAGARIVSLGYTLVVVGAAVVAARRPDHPLVWLALLALGASRSPYAPAAYVMVGTLWLLVVLAAQLAGRPRLVWTALGAGLVLQTAPFLGRLPPFWSWPVLTAIATPAMTIIVIGLSLWSLTRARYGCS